MVYLKQVLETKGGNKNEQQFQVCSWGRSHPQSKLTISGDLLDVEADSNGQSHIVINGNCQDFIGKSNGQSSISVFGKASGRIRERSYGQSHISVR